MSSKVITLIIGAAGLLLALWMGASVADENYLLLVLFALIAIGVIFVSGGYKYAFHIILVIVLLDGSFNFGFAIRSTEQFLIITCALVAATFWRRDEPLQKPQVLRHWSFSFVLITLGAWILYVLIHMCLHLLLFQTEGMKNIFKSYNATFTPYLFLFYFLARPRMFPIPRSYTRVFSMILLAVALASTLMRMYQSFYGQQLLSDDPNDAGMAGAMIVPMMNFVENVYALRGLAPIVMLFGTIILTSRAPVFRGTFWFLLGVLMIIIGVSAALFSGGRATIVIGVFMCAVALILRRKRFPIAIGGMIAILMVAAANLFSSWVNTQAPMQLARTLQWVLVEKDTYLAGTIHGSSEWRLNLAKYALKEWQKTPKTIFLGIGFQGISEFDYAVAAAAGTSFGGVSEDFAWEMGVKRVATHSMFTDLLVGYGAIGAFIYYFLLVALMALTCHIYFSLPEGSLHRDFSLLTAGMIWLYATAGNIAGTFLPITAVFLVIVLVCAQYQHQYEESSSEG